MPPFQKKETSPEPAAEAQVTLSIAELRELLGASTPGITPDVLSEIMSRTAELSAEAMRKSLKPENTFSPEISAFSYPEGERARPKPTLPFELLWGGFPVHKETSVSTWYEMEQFAQLKPGDYICSKSDMTPIKVTVAGQRGPDGQTITRLTVTFPVERDLRVTMPSPYIWAYQMNHPDKPARETYVEALSQVALIQLQDLRAKQRPLVPA